MQGQAVPGQRHRSHRYLSPYPAQLVQQGVGGLGLIGSFPQQTHQQAALLLFRGKVRCPVRCLSGSGAGVQRLIRRAQSAGRAGGRSRDVRLCLCRRKGRSALGVLGAHPLLLGGGCAFLGGIHRRPCRLGRVLCGCTLVHGRVHGLLHQRHKLGVYAGVYVLHRTRQPDGVIAVVFRRAAHGRVAVRALGQQHPQPLPGGSKASVNGHFPALVQQHRLGQRAALLLDVQGHGHPAPLLRQREAQALHARRSYAAQMQHPRLGPPAHPAESVFDDPYFHSETPSFEKGSPRQGSCFAAPPSGGLQG